jgi:filamentous hemagglutinin family protein
MNFIQEITSKIKILNQVFAELNLPDILENTDFIIDEISSERYLKLKLKQEINGLNFEIIIPPKGMEINIAHANEIFSWSNDYIDNHHEIVIKSLKEILTSHILIEQRGKNVTQIFLFNQNGICVNRMKYINGISLVLTRQRKLYSPIVRFSRKDLIQ